MASGTLNRSFHLRNTTKISINLTNVNVIDIEESTREEVEEEVWISSGGDSESGTAESIEGEP